MPSKRDVRIRRVYDEPSDGDGHRVLVDRIWPRGLSICVMSPTTSH